MLEVLNKYGFLYFGACSCLGPRTHKYKRAGYAVYWNKAAKKFRVKYQGKAITTLKNEHELEDTIKEFFPLEAAV